MINKRLFSFLQSSFLVFGFGVLPMCSNHKTTKPQAASNINPSRNDGTPETKQQKIQKIIYLTGGENLRKQLFDQMIEMIRSQPHFSGVPAEFWEESKKEVHLDELVQKMIPIYEKYLDEQMLDDLITFYESPTGKKYITLQPNILKESFKIGQTWAQELTQKFLQKMKEKSY